jgi:hypothetical protein
MDEQQIQGIMPILTPYASRKRAEAKEKNLKLVHYASAETALKILKSQEIWLRDSRCMNDYMEVQGGLNQIERFLHETARRQAFLTAVDACHAGVGQELIEKFRSWMPLFWANTYIMCMSAHKGSEDKYGRLSMWRAYGRAAGGLAIVLNAPPENVDTDFNVFLSPVAYREDIDADMIEVIANITQHRGFIASVPRDRFVNGLFSMFAMAACCLKHPGFCEEEEWRLIHLPKTWKSDFVTQDRVTIDGVPQYVYKLKFGDAVRAGYASADPPKLIERVIVGPTAFPGPISEQVYDVLLSLGFKNPNQHLSVSYIPLRM